MSRTVQGRHFLDRGAQEVFRKMLWRVADFSGLKILTYCVMHNHFHLLVEVVPEQEIDDAELVRRFAVLYPKGHKRLNLRSNDLALHLEADDARAEALREWLLGRMGDLSIFIKTLKQRFSVWYNRTHDSFGAVWAERFKSVLVEGRRHVLQTMAAYIDLNPVRAGIVKDPKDYRFCGYTEALVGHSRALSGLRRLMGVFIEDGDSRAALEGYRSVLLSQRNLRDVNETTFSKESGAKALAGRGQLSAASRLGCRLRFFSMSKALGSELFLRKVLSDARLGRTPSGRKRPIRHLGDGILCGLCSISGRRENG